MIGAESDDEGRAVPTSSGPASATGSLDRPLLAVIATLWLVPLLVLVLAGLSVAQAAVADEAQRGLRSTARATAASVVVQLDNLRDAVNQAAPSPDLTGAVDAPPGGLPADAQAVLDGLTSRDEVRAAVLLDDDGVFLGSSPLLPQLYGETFAHRDYWTGGLAAGGQPYVSDQFASASDGQRLFAVSQLLVDDAGTRGMLVVSFNTSALQQDVDAFAQEQGVTVSVLDGSGQLVVEPGLPPDVMSEGRDDVAAAAALRGRQVTAEHVVAGRPTLSAGVPLARTGWAVTTSRPSSEAYAGVASLRDRALLGSAVVGCAGLLGLLLVGRVLRSRGLAHRRAAASEALSRTLLDTAEEAYCSVDATGVVIDWNGRAEQLTGVPRADVLGRPVEALLSDARTASAFQAGLAAELAGQESGWVGRRVEVEVRGRDGVLLPVEVTSWRTADADGELVVHLLAHDVSHRREAERLRRAQAGREDLRRRVAVAVNESPTLAGALATVVDAVGEVGTADAAGALVLHHAPHVAPAVQTATWSSSPLALAAAGLLVGRDGERPTPLAVVALESRQPVCLVATDDGLVATDPTGRAVLDGVTTAGRPELGAVCLLPVHVGEEAVALVVLLWAERETVGLGLRETLAGVAPQLARVAERQRTSTQLAAARDEALESSRLKGAFLANMSHELRTPLNGVIGTAQLLLSTTETDDRQREYLDVIRTSGESLLTLINDVLDVSKIEAGVFELEETDVDVRGVLEEAVTVVAPAAQARDLELTTLVREDVPDAVRTDAVRLRQVLLNLLSNAVKFTETGEVVVSVSVDADELRLEVSDTGIGIEPEVLERLFRPFAQADASTTRRYGGTGLGLSIVAQLARLLGGDAGATSIPGRGSTFWVTVPLRPVAVPAPPEPRDDADSRLDGLRVLLVAAGPSVRGMLADTLARRGASVDCAGDEAEARRRLLADQTSSPAADVVMVAHDRGRLDGAAVATALQQRLADAGRPRVPLLLCTRRPDHVAERVVGTAADAVVVRPVRADRLAEVVAALSGRAAPSPEAADGLAGGSLSGRRVLLAEDNAVNRLVAGRLLERLGCAVDIAHDGEEAVAAAARGGYDCVLMDVQMPRVDGLRATQRIRRLSGPRGRVPVVGVTAGATDADRDACRVAGMDAYLSKPFRAEDLAAVLEHAVGGASLSPAAPAPRQRDGHGAGAGEGGGAPDEVPALDPATVAALAALGGGRRDVLAEVGRAFLSDSLPRTERLAAALRARDDATARLEAHALKGAAGALGATVLGSLCRAVEAGVAEGSPDDAGGGAAYDRDAAGQALVSEAQRVAQALRARGASLAGSSA